MPAEQTNGSPYCSTWLYPESPPCKKSDRASELLGLFQFRDEMCSRIHGTRVGTYRIDGGSFGFLCGIKPPCWKGELCKLVQSRIRSDIISSLRRSTCSWFGSSRSFVNAPSPLSYFLLASQYTHGLIFIHTPIRRHRTWHSCDLSRKSRSAIQATRIRSNGRQHIAGIGEIEEQGFGSAPGGIFRYQSRLY